MFIVNFFKKFIYTVNVKIKAMMHFFKKSMAIVFGIIVLVFLGYLFGYDSVTDTTIHKVEVSGKIQYIPEEDDRNKNGTNEYFPPRIIVWSWDGGSTIRKEQLESTILAVSKLDTIESASWLYMMKSTAFNSATATSFFSPEKS